MQLKRRPIFARERLPMRVAVFATQGPGNLRAVLDVADARRDLVEVALVVSDRLSSPAAAVANERAISVIEADLAARIAKGGASREAITDAFHNEVLERIRTIERCAGSIDLCVLAYRRIIRGALLEYFRDRMINQHPADLTVLDKEGRRRFAGISGLARSIHEGATTTCTSTILVNDGVDEGEILGQGPGVLVDRSADEVDIQAHEQKQKRESDWPVLRVLMPLLAEARLAIGVHRSERNELRTVFLDGKPLPYGGLRVDSTGPTRLDAERDSQVGADSR